MSNVLEIENDYDRELAILRKDEALRLKLYRDTKGFLTIGWGHNIEANGITKATADYIFAEDWRSAALSLAARFPWTNDLDPVRRAVLRNMTFNMGIGGLSTFRTTLGLIQRGEYDMAAIQMMRSKWAEDVGSRALKLRDMMRTGRWPEGGTE